MRLGVDIGGTFTDFVWVTDTGQVTLHKRLTTPADPAESLLAGVAALQVPPNALVIHGSTIATNALLERRGARTALVTTAGFADVIEIGRQNRPDLYALIPRKPTPLVPREWRFEIHERVSAQGEILMAADPAEILALLPSLQAAGIESVAVCFLFSFLRPEHEQLVQQILEQAPGLAISLSSHILPEYREYERLSTTVINAYVTPLMERYLARLEQDLRPRPLRIMQSNGGCITSAQARAQAGRTALSGPAGGVVGAWEVARHARAAAPAEWADSLSPATQIITFDMGGTSTDVCLCPGRIPFTAEGEISGLPLRLPIIDIHTVGAGGGSLARVDSGGVLTVGPASAGADPGPACYGHGGSIPTVTDANLLLNRLHPQHFLGGAMTLDPEAARQAFTTLQGALATSPAPALADLAWGVIQIANAAMERAIRRISVERGFDPRDFTLIAFGGAGPLHACELAERLAITRVLIPRWPGVLSALGMALSDLIKDYAQTILRQTGSALPASLEAFFAPLEARARAEMAREGIPDPQLERSVDMRYVGQSFEINVPVTGSEPPNALFHTLHAQRYGHAAPAQSVECVTVRVRALGALPPPALEPIAAHKTSDLPPPLATLNAGFEMGGHWRVLPTPVYARDQLLAGHCLSGPILVVQLDATTVIPPGWTATCDALGHLIARRSPFPA